MRITVQMGHNPPNTSRPGQTGTWREREWNGLAGPVLREELEDRGHDVVLIGTDPTAPGGDLFISLHIDSGNAQVNGPGQATNRHAIVGYPISITNVPRKVRRASRKIANEWRNEHAAIYPGGFRANNFTTALSNYYMWGNSPGKAGGGRYGAMYLAEHFVGPNSLDEVWGFSHIPEIAQAHVDAIGKVFGHRTRETVVSDHFGNTQYTTLLVDEDLIVLYRNDWVHGEQNFHALNRTTGEDFALRFGNPDLDPKAIDNAGKQRAHAHRIGERRLSISLIRGSNEHITRNWGAPVR